MRKIPGLNDLRIFESAGRLQNFRQAAEELSLSHSAVSHRIRSLEDQLGIALFERQNGVKLTDAGRELHLAVSTTLAQLGESVDRITQHHGAPRNLVRVSALPSFAAHWLLPRLNDFYLAHPAISLQIQAGIDLSEIGENGVDIALRFGGGKWGNILTKKLLSEFYYPVASPEFVRRFQLKKLTDLLTLPLLMHANTIGAGSSWLHFFKALSMQTNEPLRTISFDDGNLILQAAEHGHGVAFERHSHVHRSIKEGRLLRLFDCGLKSQFDYYLLSEAQKKQTTAVEQVIAWLIKQAAEFEAGSAADLKSINWIDDDGESAR